MSWDDGYQQGLRVAARLMCESCRQDVPLTKGMFGDILHTGSDGPEQCPAEPILLELQRFGPTP